MNRRQDKNSLAVAEKTRDAIDSEEIFPIVILQMYATDQQSLNTETQQ